MEKLLSEVQEIFITGEVCERIKYLRRFRGLTIKEVAEISITTEKCWSDWENGKAIPRKRNRKIIASALNVNEDVIFGKPKVYAFSLMKEIPSPNYNAIVMS